VTRRFVLATGLLVTAASLSSCSTFSRSDAAAEVRGEELTRTELGQLTGPQTSGDAARQTISTWLQLAVLGGDTAGISTPEELSKRLQAAESKVLEPYLAEGRTLYEKGLDGAPVACLRVIPLAAPNTSATVLAEIASGTTFEAAAAKYASDPTLAQTGGMLTDQSGNTCLAISSLNPDLITTMKTAGAVPGTPVAINFNNTDIVLLMRPFDELTGVEKLTLVQGKFAPAFKQLLADTKVYVNPRFGRWDSANAAVVALSNG
jgi:hypothetical protein